MWCECKPMSELPEISTFDKLETDYGRMSSMIFGTPLKFESVMTSIQELEALLNSIADKPSL